MRLRTILILLWLSSAFAYGQWTPVAINTNTMEVKPPLPYSTSNMTPTEWSLYPAKEAIKAAGQDLQTVNWAYITNLFVPFSPSNYSPWAATLIGHLQGIDQQIGQINYQLWVLKGSNSTEIGKSPATLSPSCTQGANPANSTVTLWNIRPTNSMAYTLTTNATWMSLSAASGTSTGEVDTITVTYAATNLTIGVYNGTIAIASPTAVNTPQSIPVTLTVNSPFGTRYNKSVVYYPFFTNTWYARDESPTYSTRNGTNVGASTWADFAVAANHAAGAYVRQTNGGNTIINGAATQVTYAAWIFHSTAAGTDFYLGSGTNPATGNTLYYSAGNFHARFATQDTVYAYADWDPSTSLTTGAWHRLVGTYWQKGVIDGVAASEIKLYFDGALKTNKANAANFMVTTYTNWTFGWSDGMNPGMDWESLGNFVGKIDDVVVTTNLWSLTDVTNDYQVGRSGAR